MGQAAVRPVRETVFRRTLAVTAAVAVNAGLVLLIIAAPRPPLAPAALATIDLVLVMAPVADVLVEPEAIAEPEADRIEAPVDAPPERRDDRRDGETSEGLQQSPPGRMESSSAAPGPAISGETVVFLRDVFCRTSSDATREAGRCPGNAEAGDLALMRHATGAANDEALQAAFGLGLSADEIRALFSGNDLGLADLRGQPALADTSQGPTSSADQMRDSLPPRHADPAFGD